MNKVLIAMAVHDTEENKRSELTERVLNALYNQDIFEDHDFWNLSSLMILGLFGLDFTSLILTVIGFII